MWGYEANKVKKNKHILPIIGASVFLLYLLDRARSVPIITDILTPATGEGNKIRQKLKSFSAIIDKVASDLALDPDLIMATIMSESSGNPNAKRYEEKINDTSCGLMQILTATARTMGYSGTMAGLFDPTANIFYGSKYLAYQSKRYGGRIDHIIAAYNAGSVRFKGICPSGARNSIIYLGPGKGYQCLTHKNYFSKLPFADTGFINEAYVNRTLKYYSQLKG